MFLCTGFKKSLDIFFSQIGSNDTCRSTMSNNRCNMLYPSFWIIESNSLNNSYGWQKSQLALERQYHFDCLPTFGDGFGSSISPTITHHYAACFLYSLYFSKSIWSNLSISLCNYVTLASWYDGRTYPPLPEFPMTAKAFLKGLFTRLKDRLLA